jgi:hypothetical protein
MSFLTSTPALGAEFIASLIGIAQALRVLTRKVALFPRWKLEQKIGHATVPILQAIATGKGMQPPEGEDWSTYTTGASAC